MRACSLCHRCYDDSDLYCTEEGHPPLSETGGGSPEMIDGYRLDFLLGSGVRGDIYRAHQTAFGRSCMIAIHSTDGQTAQKFLDEAKLAAALFHPNVADVYEAGTLETGGFFVVAEDPEDETLRDRLETSGIPKLLSTIEIVRQTAEALHALHLKGLTHRALRPENIILSTDAEQRLLVRIQNIDFAGVTERSIISNKFLIDSALDSLRYYAPEQCSGESVGIKADVYSLGIILYEMLAGAPPFDATTAAGLIEKHRNHRPPDIRIDNFELRMLITHTLMESLHKRPDKRQSSANAFARQLRHIEQLATHVSTPPPAVTVSATPPRVAERVNVAAASPAAEIVRKPSIIEAQKAIIEEQLQTKAETRERKTSVSRPSDIDLPSLAVEPELQSVHDVHPIPDVHIVQDAQLDKPADARAQIPELPSCQSAVENFGTAIASFVREKSAPAIAHFSRLKQHRKKLHSKSAPRVPETVPPPATVKKAGLVSPEAAAIELAREMAAVKQTRAKKAKKVNWKQPEDDIPSLADVQTLLAAEQVVDIPARREMHALSSVETPVEAETAVQVQPNKIELTRPEDDIPSLAEVQEVLLREKAVEIPITPILQESTVVDKPAPIIEVVAEPPTEAVAVKPVPIKTDADVAAEILKVPSPEAREVAVQGPVTETQPEGPIIERQPEKPVVAVHAKSEKPRVIAEQPQRPVTQPQPEQKKPVVETPKKAPARAVNPGSVPVFNLNPRGIRISGLQSEKTRTPIAVEELEEITLVSPARSRFRVPVNNPQPARKHSPARRVVPVPSNDSVFYPTLLGGAVIPASIEPAADSILSTYYSAPEPHALPYRSLAIGSGFVLLIAFFLFANDAIWSYASNASGDPVAVKSPAVQETTPPTVMSSITLPPAKKVPAVDRSVKKDEENTPSTASTTFTTTERATKPPAITPMRAATPDTPRPAPRPEAENRIVGKKPEPIPVRSNGATRPRIVKEPER